MAKKTQTRISEVSKHSTDAARENIKGSKDNSVVNAKIFDEYYQPLVWNKSLLLYECVSGYVPSMDNLKELLFQYTTIDNKKNTIASLKHDPTVKDNLLMESTVILLFTTRIGLDIIDLMYNIDEYTENNEEYLKRNEEKKTENYNTIASYHEWLEKNKKKVNLQLLHDSWKSNYTEYILKLYLFLIRNENLPLDFNEYNQPEFKISLNSLFNNNMTMITYTLNPNYNLLVDFFTTLKNVFELIVQNCRLLHLFRPTIPCYKRFDQFNDKYVAYSLRSNGSPLKYNGYPKRDICSNYFDRSFLNHEMYEYINSEPPGDNGYGKINRRPLAIDFLSPLFEDTPKVVSLVKANELKKSLKYDQLLEEETQYGVNLYDGNAMSAVNKPLNNVTTKNSIMQGLIWQSELRHDILAKLLNIPEQNCPFIYEQFICMAKLIDPLSQPAPNDEVVISLDLLYKLFLGFLSSDIKHNRCGINMNNDWKFNICFNMQNIITQSMLRLNCYDYDLLSSIEGQYSSIIGNEWKKYLHQWLPHGLNTQDLELIYMIDIMAVYTIYDLYSHLPIQLNPFLSTLISLWKNLSCVILLGLEIDRMAEQYETFETPLLVRATVRGASALRSVVATILNGHVQYNEHDFKHEPLNTFMSPHGRKLCQGALYADLRSHTASMLSLGVDLKDVTDLLADLQAGDRFDEDIRYMFEYEYEDYNAVKTDGDNDGENEEGDIINSGENNESQQRRCNCIFEDDKMFEDENYIDSVSGDQIQVSDQNNFETSDKNIHVDNNSSSRAKASFEFDYSGKDWRDVPRGLNLYYSPSYTFVKETRLDTLVNLTLKATSEALDIDASLELLKIVASCVKNEQESLILSKYMRKKQTDEIHSLKEKPATPDDVYELWCEQSLFENMLYLNQELAWKLMDEMLMCNGYRRVLIWFITHMELNHSLIHYIFELVMGLRGQEFSATATVEDQKKVLLHELLIPTKEKTQTENTNDKNDKNKLPFSRQGPLLLSDIETNMLLQEFFTNAAIYFSVGEGNNGTAGDNAGNSGKNDDSEGQSSVSLYSIGLVKLICFMVRTLMQTKKFDFSNSECTFELQTLLMNWIGLVPEAQELFFILKSKLTEEQVSSDDDILLEEETTNKDDLKPRLENEDRLINTSKESGIFASEDDGTEASKTTTSNTNDSKSLMYTKKLISLLPPVIEGEKENPAIETLRSFMQKQLLIKDVNVVGRKVLFRGDKVLPLHINDRAISLREYLGNFDYKPNKGDH